MISFITSSLQLLYASSHLASIAAMVSYNDVGSSGLLTGPRFVVKQVNMMRVDSARILILFFMGWGYASLPTFTVPMQDIEFWDNLAPPAVIKGQVCTVIPPSPNNLRPGT